MIDIVEKMWTECMDKFSAGVCPKAEWIHPAKLLESQHVSCDLPVVVIRSAEGDGDHAYWYSSNVSISLEQVLSVDPSELLGTESVIETENDLEYYITNTVNWYIDQHCSDGLPDYVRTRIIRSLLSTYRDKWVPCLVIRAEE